MAVSDALVVNAEIERTDLNNPANLNNSIPISAADLIQIEFPPTAWIVRDVLPEGVTLLAGKPKKGKSWLALALAEAVASGGVALGNKSVEQGETLYLALEDNQPRLQRRLSKILRSRPAPRGMHTVTSWPRLVEGGAKRIDEWLLAHPKARLIIIDTLAKVRKPARGQNIYQEDYSALEMLLPMAARHGVAIVVVHHLRKEASFDPMDEISGSTGLQGGVDGVMILRRTPGSKGPTLYVEGRDIENPIEYALSWNTDTATWTIEGEANEVHISEERQDILSVLNGSEPMKPKEVADALGAKPNNVKQMMYQMLGDGQLIKNNKGNYSPPPLTPVTSITERPYSA